MFTKIITHPSNVRAIREAIREGSRFQELDLVSGLQSPIYMTRYDVIGCDSCGKDEPTGRVRHPVTGEFVDREAFKWKADRFTTYDADSVDWLVGLKLIEEERQIKAYILDESKFRFTTFMDMGPIVPKHRGVIGSSIF